MASSNLIIDIGNTRTKAAIFVGSELTKSVAWERLSVSAVKKLTYNQSVENVILSSTAVIQKGVELYLQNNFNYIRLDHQTALPFELLYKTPQTLGIDRIAAAAGAIGLFPGENVLVIDAGTCITMDLVSEESKFIGGNISPGITMRLQAMHHFTAKLPLIRRTENISFKKDKILEEGKYQSTNFIGRSTEEAIRNGAELGALLEVTAFMEKCRRRFKPLRIVFTGGDADFFVRKVKTKIFANSNLVLTGLNKILQHNVRK